jgi:hypothetical protein
MRPQTQLEQAVAVADELRIGLVGAASIPALPARWLDGVPRVESGFYEPLAPAPDDQECE